MKRIAVALSSALLLTACPDQEPKTASPARTRNILENMRFERHPQAPDLCVGYVYVEDGSGNAATGGPAMISVDCDKVKHMLEPTEAPMPPEAPR